MTDLKAIKTLGITILATIFLAVGSHRARAVIIEGFTSTGEFVTVGVSDDGRLLISASTGIAQSVFFISSQPVNAFQATIPWTVIQSSPIVISTSIAVTVAASTAGTLSNTNFTTTPGSPSQVLAFDVTRKGSLVCNEDTAISAFFGFTVAVTTPSGKLLPAGACFSPDTPEAVYVGPLFIETTAAMRIGTVEITP